MHRPAARGFRSFLTLLGICLAGFVANAAAHEAPVSRATLDPAEALRISQGAIGSKIGDYTLLDRAGKPVRLADYRGKPLLVNFMYTGCFQVCPTSTRAIAAAIEGMGRSMDPRQFNIVSIGFNLPADSPASMKAFAAQQRIDFANWEFLSPHASAVEALTRDFGFAYAPTQSGFDHLLQVTVVDAEGRIYRQVYGEAFSADQLAEPIRQLLRNQPLPQQLDLADLVDRVRILCSIYDPATGEYRVSYALAFEIAGGVTFVIAMLWFFVGELRASRRLRRTQGAAQKPAPSSPLPPRASAEG